VMKFLFVFSLLLLFPTTFTLAQNPPREYNKVEVFAGYSNADELDAIIEDDTLEHGFNAAAVYNFHRYLGAKVDVSGTYRRYGYGPLDRFDHSIHNVTAGIQVKDNRLTSRFKPFAHALVGYGRHSDKASSTCLCQFLDRFERDGLAVVIGGGLDIKVNRRIDIRAFQFDANPIFFEESTYLNLRFSTGVVFKF